MPSPIPRRACRVIPHPRCGHPVIPHFDAGSREYRQRSSRTFGKLIPHFFIITFLVCSIAPDAVTQSSRTLMRDPEIPASLLVRFFFLDPASLCGVTRFSTRNPGYSRGLYPKKTAGSTVRATGEHGPCIQNRPFLFPQKKRENQKKAPG